MHHKNGRSIPLPDLAGPDEAGFSSQHWSKVAVTLPARQMRGIGVGLVGEPDLGEELAPLGIGLAPGSRSPRARLRILGEPRIIRP
jgi:hypothetical protein